MDSLIERIREVTKGTPYEGRLFMVGGVVRDKVMNRPPADDVDIVVEGSGPELAKFLFRHGIGDHRPVTYPRFGTAMLSVGGNMTEFVSARRESYAQHSRKPDVEPASLQDDVLRRDFTINTLLENLHTGEVLDLTGLAIADIEAGIIRTPTEPETTFFDDPLRMMRAVRFASRFGFTIEEKTWRAILKDVKRLSIVSSERIRDEFVKILLSDGAVGGIRMLDESGLLAEFAPELLHMKDVQQGGFHSWDVWEHTLRALEALPRDSDLLVRLAILFHDTGKPRTKDGHHFYGHEAFSARTARKVMNRLRFPNDQTARTARLINMHMRIGEYRSEWKDSAVRRLMHDAGSDMADLIALARADRLGSGHRASTAAIDEIVSRIEGILIGIPEVVVKSPLNGREIMSLLGIASGPKIREIKKFLVEEVIEGNIPQDDKETAREAVLREFGGKEDSPLRSEEWGTGGGGDGEKKPRKKQK